MSGRKHLHVVTQDDWTDLEAQAEALDSDCPRCGVVAGEGCVNALTGDGMRVSHWQRISAAREVVVDSDSSSRMS